MGRRRDAPLRLAGDYGGRPLSDAALQDKARLIAPSGRQRAAEVADRAIGPQSIVTRTLRFLAVEPLTGEAIRPNASLAIEDQDVAGTAVAVPGGKVTTYDKVKIFSTDPGSFGFDYEGDAAPDTGWIQFIAPEAERFDAAGRSLGFVTDRTTMFSGHEVPVPWGTTASPVWSLDGEGDTAPFYEAKATKAKPGSYAGASGSHITWPKRTAMFDRPTVDPKIVKAAFGEDDTARVVVRLRFHAYLVRRMEVLYANTMTVEFPLASARTDPEGTRRNIAGQGRAVTAISKEHHEALVKRFPGFGFYPQR